MTPDPFQFQFQVKLEAGVHFWCTCGRSGHLPLCDSSHKGTGLQPEKFVLTETTLVRWTVDPKTNVPVRKG